MAGAMADLMSDQCTMYGVFSASMHSGVICQPVGSSVGSTVVPTSLNACSDDGGSRSRSDAKGPLP